MYQEHVYQKSIKSVKGKIKVSRYTIQVKISPQLSLARMFDVAGTLLKKSMKLSSVWLNPHYRQTKCQLLHPGQN